MCREREREGEYEGERKGKPLLPYEEKRAAKM
jgi:hypothetical protein